MPTRATTAGMYLCWAVETTAGTRPTTGYQIIPEIKTMPDLNTEPNTIDSTTLLETEYETSEMGLKSLGVLTYGCNMTDELENVVDGIITAQETAEAAGKSIWYAEVNPKITKASFYAGTIASINFSDAAVGDMCNTSIYITNKTGIIRAEKPTLAVDTEV